MLRSMTGYGRFEDIRNGMKISVEVKTVNHKYYECSARVTRGYLFIEDKIRSYLQQVIKRGKVDVFVQIEGMEESNVQIVVNHAVASAYVSAMREISDHYSLPDEVSLSDLTRFPDIFTVQKTQVDEDELFADITTVADKALEALLVMRETEGGKLRDDVLTRASRILTIIDEIERLSPNTVSDYEVKLRKKIAEVLDDNRYDEQRILTEVAIFADKLAVDEETVRLRSHIDQMRKMMETDSPIGRKLDFLVQEMNREANTIGSKCMNVDISHLIVEMKAEIEKIREQVQNIE